MTAGEKFLAEYERTVHKIVAARVARERVREAAPDLLAALKQIVALWESLSLEQMPDQILYFYLSQHWDNAKAAIEKAGEWPAEES